MLVIHSEGNDAHPIRMAAKVVDEVVPMRFGVHEAHGGANVIEFNWMKERGVITVNPAKNPAINAAGATTFLEWLTSPRGQQLIAQFMINGKQLFYPSYRE